MKCVILAAGKGSRLKEKSKPATKLLGVSLIERVIRNFFHEIGVDKFVVVVGYNKEEVIKEVEGIKKKIPIEVEIVINNRY